MPVLECPSAGGFLPVARLTPASTAWAPHPCPASVPTLLPFCFDFGPQIVGDRYGVGIDDTHVRLRGAPVLDEPALDVHQQVGGWVWAGLDPGLGLELRCCSASFLSRSSSGTSSKLSNGQH